MYIYIYKVRHELNLLMLDNFQDQLNTNTTLNLLSLQSIIYIKGN